MKLKLLKKILGLTTIDEIIDLLNQPENARIMIDVEDGCDDTLPSALKIIVDYLFFLTTKRKPNKKNAYAFFTAEGQLFVNEFFETEDIAYKFEKEYWRNFEIYQHDKETQVKLKRVLNDTPNLFRMMYILIMYAGTGLRADPIFNSANFKKLYENPNILNIFGCKNIGTSNDPITIELISAFHNLSKINPTELILAKSNILKKIQKTYLKYCSYIKSSSSDLIKDPIAEEFLKIELLQKNESPSVSGYFYDGNYLPTAIDYKKNSISIQSIFVVENYYSLRKTKTSLASTLEDISSIRNFSFDTLNRSYILIEKYNSHQLREIVYFLKKIQENISDDKEKKELFDNAISILRKSGTLLIAQVNRIILTLLQIMPYRHPSKNEDSFISIEPLQPIREVEQLPTIIDKKPYFFEKYFSLQPIREIKNFKRAEYNLSTRQVLYKKILSIIYEHSNLIDYSFLCDSGHRAEAFNDARKAQEYYQERDKLLSFNIFTNHLKKIKEAHDENPEILIKNSRNWLFGSGSSYLKDAAASIIEMCDTYIHAEFVTIWIKHHCSDKGFELKQIYNQGDFLGKMKFLTLAEYAPARYFLFEFYKDSQYLLKKSSYPPILHALGLIYAAKVIPHARRRIAEKWGEQNVVNILSNFARQNYDPAQITRLSYSYLSRAATKEYAPAQYDLSLFFWCTTPVGREEISVIREASYRYLKIAAMKDYEPAIRLWTILTQRYEFSSLRPLPILPHEISLKIANYVYPDKEAKLDYVLGEEKTFNLWITKMLELLKWELAFYYRDEYSLKKHDD